MAAGRFAWDFYNETLRRRAGSKSVTSSPQARCRNSSGPNGFDVEKIAAGKTVAIFALPGAFCPTCFARHVPGYVKQAEEFKAADVDEIWCVSMNDAFAPGAVNRKPSARFT